MLVLFNCQDLQTYNKCIRDFRRLCRVQVKSKQMTLESLAEAGERLCCPDSG